MLLGAGGAVASERVVVELVRSEQGGGLESRIGAELGIAGFRVRRVAPAPLGEDPVPVGPVGARIECDPASGLVEVVYSDDGNTLHHWSVGFPEDSGEYQVVALQVSELLRAVYLKEPSAMQVPAPPPTKEVSHRRTFTGSMGGGVLAGSMDVNPCAALMLELELQLHGVLGVELRGVLPLTATRVETEGARAGVRPGAVGTGLRLGFGKRVQPVLGAGYALWLFRAESQPAQGYNGGGDLQLVTGPYAHLGFTFWIRERVALWLEGMGSFTLAAVRYQVDGRDVATFGQPIVTGMLGFSVRMRR